jgi:hypothetical protein
MCLAEGDCDASVRVRYQFHPESLLIGCRSADLTLLVAVQGSEPDQISDLVLMLNE